MNRWIDYDAIDYRNDRLHDKSEEFLNGVIYMAQRIEEAPSIDIVRCEECKYRKNRIDYEKDYCIEHSKVIYNTDGYCSWAERSSE